MPTQTAYAVYSAKEKAKSSVSDFKRGMVQEQQSDSRDDWKSRNSIDKISLTSVWSFKRHKKQGRHSERRTDQRQRELPVPMSDQPQLQPFQSRVRKKMQEVKRPATSTTSKASEPVKTNVVKERPLSSGASDRKATQPTQTVHRQNVEKVVSQETRQNYKKTAGQRFSRPRTSRRTSRPQRKPVTL